MRPIVRRWRWPHPQIDVDVFAQANAVLEALDAQEVDRASQMILNELGETLTIDGVIGGDTRTAIARIAEAGAPIVFPMRRSPAPSRLQRCCCRSGPRAAPRSPRARRAAVPARPCSRRRGRRWW